MFCWGYEITQGGKGTHQTHRGRGSKIEYTCDEFTRTAGLTTAKKPHQQHHLNQGGKIPGHLH
jgi:hypothetical protein